jgi:hypothetical protein
MTTYSISPNPASVNENAGTLTFTITRSNSSAATTVYASTVQDQGYTDNNDYTGIANQAVSFAVGQSQATVSVNINDLGLTSGSETFRFIAQQNAGDLPSTYLATENFTIVNNDVAVSLNQEYLDASNAVYAQSKTVLPEPGWTLLMDSRDVIPGGGLSDGFFAQAFEDTHGRVIIAFEGSDLTGTSAYAQGSRSADSQILAGDSLIAPLIEAVTFAQAVQAKYGSLPIYLTGHSLGGAEAEEVAFAAANGQHLLTPIAGGATFGAPGVSVSGGNAIPANFINFIDFGDLVGNYAKDSSSELNLISLTGGHVGIVQSTGTNSNSLFGQSLEIAAAIAHGDDLQTIQDLFGVAAYHELSHYVTDLGLTPPPVTVIDFMPGSTSIVGTSGNDFILAGAGNYSIDGGGGQNTVSYSETLTGSSVTLETNGSIVVSGPNGTQTLTNIQEIQFTDGSLIFNEHSAQDQLVYELYQAAFNRTPDRAGFLFWANVADSTNTAAVQFADYFMSSSEFSQKYGVAPTNLSFATELYANVLGRAPDQAGLAFWVNVLNNGLPRDQVLIDFAQSTENVGLIAPHIANGFWVTV